jgi:tyrosinase
MATTKTKNAKAKIRKIPNLPKAGKRFVSAKIDLESLNQDFYRADIIFDGVDHAGATFEARVFLNNESANADTATAGDQGYAGSFHIFGHGGCFGEVGHCEVRGNPRPYDPRPAHALSPARKVLIATDAIKRTLAKSKQVIVTVVPIVRAGTTLTDFDDVLKFDKLSIQTYK